MGEMKREVTVSRLVISALLQSHTVGTPLGGAWAAGAGMTVQ